MPEDSTQIDSEAPTPRRDAAGWALSAVTCLVLTIGVLVIRSTTSEEEPFSPSVVTTQPEIEESIEIGQAGNDSQNWIVLEPSGDSSIEPAPRQLPPITRPAGPVNAQPFGDSDGTADPRTARQSAVRR